MEEFNIEDYEISEKANVRKFEVSKDAFLTFAFSQKQIFFSSYFAKSEELSAKTRVICINDKISKVIKFVGIVKNPQFIREKNKIFGTLSVYTDIKIARFSNSDFMRRVAQDYKISVSRTKSVRLYLDIANVKRNVAIKISETETDYMDVYQLFDVPSKRADLRTSETVDYERYYNEEAAKAIKTVNQ